MGNHSGQKANGEVRRTLNLSGQADGPLMHGQAVIQRRSYPPQDFQAADEAADPYVQNASSQHDVCSPDSILLPPAASPRLLLLRLFPPATPPPRASPPQPAAPCPCFCGPLFFYISLTSSQNLCKQLKWGLPLESYSTRLRPTLDQGLADKKNLEPLRASDETKTFNPLARWMRWWWWWWYWAACSWSCDVMWS